MTHPSLAPAGLAHRSPFAGQRVAALTRLDIDPGGPQPRFDEDVWDLRGLRGVPIQLARCLLVWDFTTIASAAWRLVGKEYAVALLAPGDEHVATLPRARRKPLNPKTCQALLKGLTGWLRWLAAHGMTHLAQVTQPHCDGYLHTRHAAGLGTSSLMNDVIVIKDLARYGEVFTADRYPPGFMPWPATSAAIVAGVRPRGANVTPPVPEHLLRPALSAGLYLVEVLGPHVAHLAEQIAARRGRVLDHRRLRRQEFDDLFNQHIEEHRPLPELDAFLVQQRLHAGWQATDPLLRMSFLTLANDLGMAQIRTHEIPTIRDLAEAAIAKVGTAPRWAREAAAVERADGGGPTPWTVPLTPTQADDLPMIVFNACLFVATAVSGMRTSELMELTSRSCPPPHEVGPGLVRYRLTSKRIKGEPLGGVADEWVIIEPGYRAVELAIRLSAADRDLTRTDPNTSIFGSYSFYARFNTFRRWVGSPAGQRLGLQPIPDGLVNSRMLRRTLSLELAYRPHGLLAAKFHLKHISVVTTEGYANQPGGSQARFHAESAAEERRQHQHLTAAAFRDYQRGILPTGPGARALIETFTSVDEHLRQREHAQPVIVGSDRHVELLLKKRAATLHIQPANYCWFTDPAKALCLALAGTPTATTPLTGLCDATRCPQATFHRHHRAVWASCADTTQTFLANPRIPAGEKARLTGKHERALHVVDAIDLMTGNHQQP